MAFEISCPTCTSLGTERTIAGAMKLALAHAPQHSPVYIVGDGARFTIRHDGKPAIHDTTVYKVFAKWSDDGAQLDLRILHGNGTHTVAKKGGDGIGYAGHKPQKGEKVIAMIDNHGSVLAPLPVAPVNEADTVLLPEGLKALKRVARRSGRPAS